MTMNSCGYKLSNRKCILETVGESEREREREIQISQNMILLNKISRISLNDTKKILEK